MCHVGTILVAVGLFTGAPGPNAVGLAWLVLGVGLWVLDLLGGGELLPTSLLTHVGGPALGVYGVRRLGAPAGVWWRAVVGFAALQLLTRAITPAASNVNVAFRPWGGWETRFPSYLAYEAFLLALGATGALVIEVLCRRLAPRDVRAAS